MKYVLLLVLFLTVSACGTVYKQTPVQTAAPDGFSVGVDLKASTGKADKIKFGMKWDLK